MHDGLAIVSPKRADTEIKKTGVSQALEVGEGWGERHVDQAWIVVSESNKSTPRFAREFLALLIARGRVAKAALLIIFIVITSKKKGGSR